MAPLLGVCQDPEVRNLLRDLVVHCGGCDDPSHRGPAQVERRANEDSVAEVVHEVADEDPTNDAAAAGSKLDGLFFSSLAIVRNGLDRPLLVISRFDACDLDCLDLRGRLDSVVLFECAWKHFEQCTCDDLDEGRRHEAKEDHASPGCRSRGLAPLLRDRDEVCRFVEEQEERGGKQRASSEGIGDDRKGGGVLVDDVGDEGYEHEHSDQSDDVDDDGGADGLRPTAWP